MSFDSLFLARCLSYARDGGVSVEALIIGVFIGLFLLAIEHYYEKWERLARLFLTHDLGMMLASVSASSTQPEKHTSRDEETSRQPLRNAVLSQAVKQQQRHHIIARASAHLQSHLYTDAIAVKILTGLWCILVTAAIVVWWPTLDRHRREWTSVRAMRKSDELCLRGLIERQRLDELDPLPPLNPDKDDDVISPDKDDDVIEQSDSFRADKDDDVSEQPDPFRVMKGAAPPILSPKNAQAGRAAARRRREAATHQRGKGRGSAEGGGGRAGALPLESADFATEFDSGGLGGGDELTSTDDDDVTTSPELEYDDGEDGDGDTICDRSATLNTTAFAPATSASPIAAARMSREPRDAWRSRASEGLPPRFLVFFPPLGVVPWEHVDIFLAQNAVVVEAAG